MTGTDYGGDSADSVIVSRIRVPKLKSGSKTVIDYTILDRHSHGKFQELINIPNNGEVLKCRANPANEKFIASMTTKGLIDIF